MGWRVTVKAGKVRDMKNKRKTGKKRGWSGGSGPGNNLTAAVAANTQTNLAISAQSATVSSATPAPAVAPAVAQPAAAAAATPTVATAIAPTKPIAVPDPAPAIATVLSPVTASPLAAPSAAANPTSSNQPAIVKAAVTSGIAKPPEPPLYNNNSLNIVRNRTVPQHLYELVNADITNESYTNETFSCEINRIPIIAQKSNTTPQVFDCTILSKPNLIAQP